MLAFKVDENMPAEVAAQLIAAGHDARTVPDQEPQAGKLWIVDETTARIRG